MTHINRRTFLGAGSLALLSLAATTQPVLAALTKPTAGKRIGIIGLDTSHAIAFTKSIHSNPSAYRGYQVVAAYPYGTKTIPSATNRIPGYIEDIKKYKVNIVASIADLLKQVDVVLLETNDGRLHLEQAKQVFEAGKPLFIDKPLAASFADAQEIVKLSKHYKTPFFSSSSLRYIEGMADILAGTYGKVLGADVYTPATLESTHPDFFWYGIHGVEMLFAAMGVGCQTVSRTHTANTDVLVGIWDDGRLGTVRGTRSGKGDFGGTIFCEKASVKLGSFTGYDPLLKEIVAFFDTLQAPFNTAETLEICAFIDAADASKRAQGRPTPLPTAINQPL